MTFLIDTDAHIIEAADTWTSRMSTAKWGSAVPHVRYVEEQKSDVWFVGDTPVMHTGFCVLENDGKGGMQRNEDFPGFVTVFDEMHPSATSATERAKVMDTLGIAAAALYPNLGFIGPDIYRALPEATLEYQVEIARAYNDWLLDWSNEAPGRFIPLACIPYWDVPSAVAEIERCAELGHKGFVSTGAPDLHGEPYLADPHWDPMWAAAQATGLPISFHVGGASREGLNSVAKRLSVEGRNGSQIRSTASEFLRNGIVAIDLVMSGVLPRFPELNFILVESGVGWIPFALESMDWLYDRYDLHKDHPDFTEYPSYYFKRQVFANLWFEKLTQDYVDAIGADNLLFETDYPHPTCLIEGEVDAEIENSLGQVSQEVREKVLWRNAAKLFKVDLEPGTQK